MSSRKKDQKTPRLKISKQKILWGGTLGLNFILIAGLAVYTYLPKKLSIDIYPKDLPVLPPAVF
ncbi:hypothetical protein [Pleurocapsa sp. PCC 7327]|uniref:hypothetical protein n=1 Tax=Pleurocapsa sp. PCC 7327 TaxID=118163 RepID=UPI0003120527|nr:hypothetical protein [Pleurocapsa sp. PCC 7327]